MRLDGIPSTHCGGEEESRLIMSCFMKEDMPHMPHLLDCPVHTVGVGVDAPLQISDDARKVSWMLDHLVVAGCHVKLFIHGKPKLVDVPLPVKEYQHAGEQLLLHTLCELRLQL